MKSHPRQSGTSTRPGRCQAGRASLRNVLYRATLSVVKTRCGLIHALHQRLRETGKAFKPRVVAAMRKLLVALNAMIRNEQHWTQQTDI
ncbi:MAG: transposase [Pseudomonadota bacterium]